MVETKSLEQTNKNWKASHGRVASAYTDGVKGAQNVIQKAIDGEDNYAAGVQRAVADKQRVKGLQRVTDEDWRRGAVEKGAARIAPGMAASEAKYNRGMTEVLSTINSVNLPPKTQDPAANVQNRVTPIAVALHNMKRSR